MARTKLNILGNKNEDTNYNLQCVFCGINHNISLVAHRNDKKYITGFVVVCENCRNQLGDWYVRTELKKEINHNGYKRSD